MFPFPQHSLWNLKNLIFGPLKKFFVPEIPKQQFVKIYLTQFSAFIPFNLDAFSAISLHVKKPFWVTFCPNRDLKQKHQCKISPRKSFESILSFYTAVTSCKISGKFHAFIFIRAWKPDLETFWPKNFKTNISPETFFLSFNTSYCCNFISFKLFHALTSCIDNTSKTWFWGPFGAKPSKQSFSTRKQFASILILYAAVIFRKLVPCTDFW